MQGEVVVSDPVIAKTDGKLSVIIPHLYMQTEIRMVILSAWYSLCRIRSS